MLLLAELTLAIDAKEVEPTVLGDHSLGCSYPTQPFQALKIKIETNWKCYKI